MTTMKLYITETSDSQFIRNKQDNYSYAFRRLYKMIEESSDKGFISRFKEAFSLNDIEYRSVLAEVKSFRKRYETDIENKTKRIEELNEVIADKDTSKRDRYKTKNTIAYLTKGLTGEPVFGGLSLQRRFTAEHNKKDGERDDALIARLKDKWHEKRVLPFFLTGEANQEGNRFFDFSRFADGVIIYKPFKGKKIVINVKLDKGRIAKTKKIVKAAKAKTLSVSVTLSTRNICLSYDEELLNGYAVNEVERRADVKEIKARHYPKEREAQLIKDKYKEYYDKQRECKLKGKLKDRCIAVDMNPTNIGYSILDKKDDGEVKVVACGVFDLSKLCTKSGKSSDADESRHLRNKRCYEITMVVKRLFTLAKHYRCSLFVIEDLEFGGSLDTKEANRLTNNVWNRELFADCVTRRCNESGIELLKVDPSYSSFIGNIQHPYTDSCNASIEIGRRGLHKYTKGGKYPLVTSEDIRTLDALFGDVALCSTGMSWIEYYKSLKRSLGNREFQHRWRAGLDDTSRCFTAFSIFSHTSRISTIIFN